MSSQPTPTEPRVRPSSWSLAWLEKALRHHPAGTTILGDLLEDFHALARAQGDLHARSWFWRQALWLGISFHFFRLLHRLEQAASAQETHNMLEALSPRGILSDCRYALRTLRRDLGLLGFSTLITGLGVGATTAVFSVMNPLLLQPLPFAEPERLVWISKSLEGGRSAVTSRTSNLRDFREMSSSCEAIAGYDAFFEQQTYTLTGSGEPERLAGVGVTDNFLSVLGVEPFLGRSFTPEEGTRWDDSAILLSHATWQRRFAADPGIVGTALTINGGPSTVIGVLPPTFDFSSVFTPSNRVDLLTTFPIDDRTDRWGNTTSMIGRLAPEATLEGARAEIAVILKQLKQASPERWGLSAELTPMREQISGDHETALLLLFGAALSVLLIVCVNLSSLLLSKGIRRRKEMYLRAALGAPGGRLLRQMLIESLILAGCGAAVGIGLAILITRAVASSSAVAIPLLASARVDGWALAFSCAVAVGAGLVVGLLPALQASGAGSAGALRAASRTMTSSLRARWLREGLVVAEVAVACALLVNGALLLQSFSKVLEVDLGFEPTHLAAWLVDTDRQFEDLEESAVFYASIVEKVRAVPGVTAVGLTDAIPLGINRQWSVGIAGRDLPPGERPAMYPHLVDRHYHETMGIPLVAGRGFQASDTVDSEPVALINESAARALFPGEEAIGRALVLNSEIRIVGVVADVKHLALEQGSGLQLYLPMTQAGDYSTLDLVVRSELPLESIQGAV
ncbi:MAG: ABC transporter permease, partial [Holophagales bacterium]|nr:ABC transporter permease [Holophagales bacterium]